MVREYVVFVHVLLARRLQRQLCKWLRLGIGWWRYLLVRRRGGFRRR